MKGDDKYFSLVDQASSSASSKSLARSLLFFLFSIFLSRCVSLSFFFSFLFLSQDKIRFSLTELINLIQLTTRADSTRLPCLLSKSRSYCKMQLSHSVVVVVQTRIVVISSFNAAILLNKLKQLIK